MSFVECEVLYVFLLTCWDLDLGEVSFVQVSGCCVMQQSLVVYGGRIVEGVGGYTSTT